jgi:hypothetical protein
MGDNPIKCLKLLKDHKTCAITVGTRRSTGLDMSGFLLLVVLVIILVIIL